MSAYNFLKNKGYDVDPDIFTEEYRELTFNANELIALLEEYKQLNNNYIYGEIKTNYSECPHCNKNLMY